MEGFPPLAERPDDMDPAELDLEGDEDDVSPVVLDVLSVASERGLGLSEYLELAGQCVSAVAGELLTMIEEGQITGSDAVITAMAIGRLQAAEDALDSVELSEGGEDG